MLKRRLTPTLKNSRKGQTPTGSQAATLIVLITLLIIFYLLFIPPDIRDQILEGDEENISETSTTTNKTLLLETPGTLEEMEEKDVEHLINAVYLFATEEAKVLERTPALSVKNSWFTKKSANLTFRIEEKKRVENVLLSFLAEDRKGILTIKFNGVEIYSGELSSPNIEP
ncbi:MAG: hypothetical protein KJ574_03595, partial [Nanoarchaeota archaeon]|nr:hypothetical protein [Nanoarchaeota archaeon]